MPFEDKPPTLAPLPPDLRLALGWYRCTGCRARQYCPAGMACRRCGGEYRQPPAWTTMLAPRWGDGRVDLGG